MIDDDRTLQLFGYISDKLKFKSNKKVVVVCEGCGVYNIVQRKRSYRYLCRSCAQTKRWSDPDERERNRVSQLKRYEDPNERDKYRVANLKRYGDPVEHERTSKASKAMWQDPAYRDKRRLAIKGYWDDPSKSRPLISEETRKKQRMARLGKPLSAETCAKMSASRMGDKNPNFGKLMPRSFESRRKQSATWQGKSYDDWEGFAMNSPYCPKFNEACRESNREKYDRRCFLSNVTEEENGQKLPVHHYDMNKAQGCDGHTWKLVPLCRKLHSTSHTQTWVARIVYLLEHVWTPGRNNVIS